MDQQTAPQTFLFTFRSNGKHEDRLLIEALAEQLADYDPSVAPASLKLSWYGNEDTLGPAFLALGMPELDVEHVLGALRDHRDADRRLEVTPAQLETAGFQPAA